jgi:hypothetical protein
VVLHAFRLLVHLFVAAATAAAPAAAPAARALAIFTDGLAALLAILLDTLLDTLLDRRRGVLALCGCHGRAFRAFRGGVLDVMTFTMLAIPAAAPPATAAASATFPRRAFGALKAFRFRGLTGFAGFLLGLCGFGNLLVRFFFKFGFRLVGRHKARLDTHR